MRIAGRFRSVSRKDHAISRNLPRPLSGRDQDLEIRVWSKPECGQPLLLVSASRKQGGAVERNRFRRRARMAFLQILRSAPPLPLSGAIVWVRPARSAKAGCRIAYADIEAQLRLALSRWIPR